MTLVRKVCSVAVGVTMIAATIDAFSPLKAQTLHGSINRVFATDVTAGPPALQPLGVGAASVNGHMIPMSQVIGICLKDDRANVVDQMVQNYVVDRECAKRGIVVTDSDIDKAVDELQKNVAPTPLDQVIAQHHSTMADVRFDYKENIERIRLVLDQIAPTKIVHCRAITVSFGPMRSQADALALIKSIQHQLTEGTNFADIRDIGMLYAGRNNMETPMLDAGLALNTGGITQNPVQLINAYCLIQAISTSSDHPKREDPAYAAALSSYKAQRAPMLESKAIIKLIQASRVEYYVHD